MTFIPSVNYEYAIFNEAPKLVLFNPFDLNSKLFYKTISNISNITKLGITNVSSTIKNVSNISNAIVKPVMKDVSNDMVISQFFLFILFFILLFSLFKSRAKSSIRIIIKTKNNSEYVTTIVNYMARLPTISHLVFNQNFYVSYDQKEFQIYNDIYGRFMIVDDDTCVLDITSSTLDAIHLREFLDSIYTHYVNNDKGQYLYTARPSNYSAIRFNKTLFNTEITFDHIFNKEIESGVKHIRFFINNKKWYEQNGFPYTLGVLAHGPSGCGKTSFIKAIANECGRNVIMVPLDKKTKIKQLESLFFNENISVYNSNTKQTRIQYIPFHNRMYVVENIDRISSKQFSAIKELLYGLLESPERLVVFTAEKIKQVDKSLLAAGRIDAQVYLDYCNIDTIMDMVTNFYETNIEDYDEFKSSLCDNVLTPSIVYEILFRNITNHDNALNELTEKCNLEMVENTIENDLQKDVDSIISQELEEEQELESKYNQLLNSLNSSVLEKEAEKTHRDFSSEELEVIQDIELVDFKISKSAIKEEILEKVLQELDNDDISVSFDGKDCVDSEMAVDLELEKGLVDYELSDSDFSENANESGLTQSQFLKGISVISSMSDKVHKKSVILDDFFDVKNK